MILPFIFVALGIGGLYYWATHPGQAAEPAGGLKFLPAGPHKLMPDTWYRVTCLTSQDVIDKVRKGAPEGASQVTLQNNFKGAIERVGFTNTKLALQDPLNPLGWVFISQWHHPAQDAIPALDGLTITNLQSVEAPPDLSNRPESPSTLDAGIPYDEAHAVAYALAKDVDPKHLRNFAKTLRPDFPISAALLDAKATLIETMSKGGAVKVSGKRISLDANSILHKRVSVSGVNLAKLPLPGYVKNPTATLSAVTRGLGAQVSQTWKKFDGYTNILGGAVPGPSIWLAETGAKTLVDIARRSASTVNPERVSRETAPFLKSLKSSSPLLARIPGIGLGVSTALEAGAGLALGEPLTESLFGPVVADSANTAVFRGAMNAGAIMAPEEGLRAQRARLPNDNLRALYDAGLAVGRAQGLQEAGFQGLYPLLKGNTLMEKANHFAASARKSGQVNRDLKDLLTEDLVRETSKIGKDQLDQELRPLLAAVARNERLQKMSPLQLSKAARVSEAAAWAALACVKRLPGGIGLLDPNLVRKILPSPPRDVSASALALVSILKRPGQEWPGLEQPTVNTETGLWGVLDDLTDPIGHVANGLVDALHVIPGMDWAGEQLKDFAKTGVGEWALRIIATYGYYVAAPYLGAQLASVSFAMPGLLKAEPFLESWIKETMDRVIKTVEVLIQSKLPDVGETAGKAGGDAFKKFLADNPVAADAFNKLMAETTTATDLLKDKLGPEVLKKIKDGAKDALDSAVTKLGAEYGYPPDFAKMAKEAGIRMDSAAAAYDLIAKTNYQGKTVWDPKSGMSEAARLETLRKSKFQSISKTTASTASARATAEAAAMKARIQKAKFSSVQAAPPAMSQREMQAAQTRAKLAQSRFSEVKKGVAAGDPNAKAAQVQLLRANQILERRKWIEHYKKIERAEHERRPVSSGTNPPQAALG